MINTFNIIYYYTYICIYIFFQCKIWKVSTLWCHYSMLKSTIQVNDNIDISQYKKVIALLKRQNDQYKPTKSNVLTMENILTFLKNADDKKFLFIKVVLIFGIHSACRKCELYNLTINDIETTESMAIVTLRNTKTKVNRIFVIANECNGFEYSKHMIVFLYIT